MARFGQTFDSRTFRPANVLATARTLTQCSAPGYILPGTKFRKPEIPPPTNQTTKRQTCILLCLIIPNVISLEDGYSITQSWPSGTDPPPSTPYLGTCGFIWACGSNFISTIPCSLHLYEWETMVNMAKIPGSGDGDSTTSLGNQCFTSHSCKLQVTGDSAGRPGIGTSKFNCGQRS